MADFDAAKAPDESGETADLTASPPIASSGMAPGMLLAEKYKLLRVLGSGGLGEVWLAEQSQPVRRKVALKLVKLGMDSQQVLARFDAERNALSIMNHPSIARVFDAGVTDRGRPFFVMEYVPGEPITAFCDRERLDPKQRLELFVQVCEAVQHAHQKAIIHRDLKPSNILVMMHEGAPLPKVIDFGIAKATGQELTENTLFTEHGQLIGTPEYMSPEQAETTAVGVDSTTDIYSLGVILYELLTGVLPFDTRALRSKGVAEIQRIIREEEPQKPSTRLSTLGDATDTVLKQRRTDTKSLKRLLKGDLDWITMRAMEKQRTRRYASASELGADIERHLRNEPVLAGPPSLAYRMNKFVRRNRAAVISGSVIGVVFLLGVAALAWGLIVQHSLREDAVAALSLAERESARARAAEDEARVQRARAEKAAVEAMAEARRATAMTGFVLDVLGLADPDVSQSPNTTMQELLVHAGNEVGDALRTEPRAEHAIRVVLARTLNTLGEHEAARGQIDRAMRLADELDDLTVDARLEMLLADLWITADSLDSPWPAVMRWWNACEEMIGSERPELLPGLRRLRDHAASDDADEARAALRDVLRMASTQVPREDIRMWSHLAGYLHASGERINQSYPLGVECMQAAIEINRRLYPETHSSIVRATMTLIDRCRAIGDHREAARLAREQLERVRRVLPDGHWYIGHAELRLGRSLAELGEREQAEALLLSAAERLGALSGARPPHFEVAVALVELYEAVDRAEDAAKWRDRAARVLAGMLWSASPQQFALALPPDRREVADLLVRFDDLYDQRLAVDESLALRLLELAKQWERSDPRAGALAELVRFRANRQRARGNAPIAEQMFLHSIAVFRENPHTHKSKLGRALREYAQLLVEQGRFAEAEPVARESMTILRSVHGDEYEWTADAHRYLGLALVGLDRSDEGERHGRLAYDAYISRGGTRSSAAQAVLEELTAMLARTKGHDEAAAFATGEIQQHLTRRGTSPAWLRRAAWSVLALGGVARSHYEIAALAADRSLELEPTSSEALSMVARAQMRLGKYEQSRATMEKAVAAGRVLNVFDLGTMALTSRGLGRVEEAEKSRDAMRQRMVTLKDPPDSVTWFVDEVERTLGSAPR